MDWDTDSDAPSGGPRRPGWGCLAALIVCSLGLVVLVVLAARWFGAIDVPTIR
jgi:hypothetical protein